MDGIERVQARIVDVRSRLAQFPGVVTTVRPGARPRAAVDLSTVSSTAAASFRDVAASFGLSAADLGGMGSLDTTSATAAARGRNAGAPRAPGTFGPVVLPAELAGRRNGELPESLLEPIGQDGHRLSRSAAVAFRRMAAAARQDGVTLEVSDSYRSVAEQQRLAGALGLYREGGLAAVPGTSTHGWGLSVDIDVDDRTTKWLRANAGRFGFAEDVAREPWHYTYRPADL